MPKGSDLLVAALENEGVNRIFGVPGEATTGAEPKYGNQVLYLEATAGEDGLGEPRATQIARLRGCEYARSPRRLNWWRELTPDPTARSFRLSPFCR